jgi:hypothetical protein
MAYDWTDYQKYFKSDEWREDRERYLSCVTRCEWCETPRKLVVLAYGKDLQVHTRGEKRLEALCARCSEITTQGASTLSEIQPPQVCEFCHNKVWEYDPVIEPLCCHCALLFNGVSPGPLTQILWMVDKDEVAKAFQLITKYYDAYPDGHDELMWELHDLPMKEGYVKHLRDTYHEDADSKNNDKLSQMPEPKGKPN